MRMFGPKWTTRHTEADAKEIRRLNRGLAEAPCFRKRMSGMQFFARIRHGLLAVLAVLGSIAILALMLHVAADVVLRNVANMPIPATYEIVTNYYMIALAFIPLAWVERRGGMVSVEAVDPLLSSRLLFISDRIVALVSTAIYAALSWFTLKTALVNYAAGTFAMAQNVSIPIWPAYFLLPLGFSLSMTVTASRIFSPDKSSSG